MSIETRSTGWQIAAACALLGAAGAASAQPQGGPVYRCPGNPVLYTDAMTPKEAQDKGCRTIEGAPVTVMQTVRPRAPAPAASAPRPADSRVSPADQRARDGEARAILQAELRREEERLAALKKEFNNGEPERRGDERNYQKYLDRVAELKAGIARKEADIASIRREIDKLPQ